LWSNPANWSGNSAPAAGDDLLFPTGALQETSVNDLGFTFNSITTADTYSFSGQALTTSFLNVNQASLELACSATVSGTTTVAAGASLTVDAGNTLDSQGALNVTANVTATGSLTVQETVTVDASGTLTDQGIVTVAPGGTLTDQGTVTVASGGTLDDFGVAANAVTVDVGVTLGVSGKLIVESNAFLDIKGTVEINAGGSLNNQGTVTVDDFGTLIIEPDAALDDSGTLIIEPGGALDGFGTLIIEPGAVLDIFGPVTVEPGATYKPLGTVTVEPGGTLTILGQATPVIVVSTSSFNLGTTTQGTAGTSQSFTVSGSNLTADILLTAPTGVQLSDNGGTSYSSTLNLAESGGTVGTTTILARIAATAPLGPVSGVIAADSTGATEQDITVSGTVIPVPTPIITVSTNSLNLGTTTQGTAGTSQSFTVGGSNLTADILLTA